MPPEFQPLLDEIAVTPEHVRAMWRYAIALVMIDDEKARIVETHQDGETLHLLVRTLAGDQFEVVRPPMSDETERMLLERLRQIMAEDGLDETEA